MAKKKKKEAEKPSAEWMGTYGDMITLVLCFFVALYNPDDSDPVQLAAMSAALTNNPNTGGISMSSGRLADLGNTVSALPSIEKGKMLGPSLKKATSVFSPDIKSNKVTISSDERGLVITMAADSFFAPGSAELNIDETRETLLRISDFLADSELSQRKFRIEGHTGGDPVDPDAWPSNWELSAARANNVLHYLSSYGTDEARLSTAAYADNQPKFSNDTPEGSAYNRRVDIIILDEGHF
ncbi:MAG: flagellar motor protein MotB [Treponemataceae bacterium]|nr:MAG: flagellar motor protein MotB [Treponemataceae bacterium]